MVGISLHSACLPRVNQKEAAEQPQANRNLKMICSLQLKLEPKLARAGLGTQTYATCFLLTLTIWEDLGTVGRN